MKFKLYVQCDCGNEDTINPVRITNQLVDGPVYEDYTSIEDGITEENTFRAERFNEDEIQIRCKQCGHKHDLSL